MPHRIEDPDVRLALDLTLRATADLADAIRKMGMDIAKSITQATDKIALDYEDAVRRNLAAVTQRAEAQGDREAAATARRLSDILPHTGGTPPHHTGKETP